MGMATHILCDKTGTLTKNEMLLRGMHTKGRSSEAPLDSTTLEDMIGRECGLLLLLALLLCNSLEIDSGSYRGTSQEEVAIMNGLKRLGAVLAHRGKREVSEKIGDVCVGARMLSVMEFMALDSKDGCACGDTKQHLPA